MTHTGNVSGAWDSMVEMVASYKITQHMYFIVLNGHSFERNGQDDNFQWQMTFPLWS